MPGGFKFGQSSVEYNSSLYSSKKTWAHYVHLARCQAFLRASYKENPQSPWTCPSEQGGDQVQVLIEGTQRATIQEIRAHQGNNEDDYPAFITFFKNPRTNAEYCIITSNGFHANSSNASDATKGLYVHSQKLVCNGVTNNRYYPMNLAHAFAKNSFASYDVGNSNMNPGELSISNCFNTDINRSYSSIGTQHTANSNDGMIYNPTNGRTYQFGYAIKDNMIEAFYRVSNYESNTGWLWCIIGEIFDNTCLVNTYPVGSFKPSRGSMTETGYLQPSTISNYAHYTASEVIGKNGNKFPTGNMGYMSQPKTVIMPSFLPNRCDTNTPDELIYAAACVGWGGAPYANTINNAGIDGKGNCVKGYIKTDLLRMVSFLATKIGGTTYQSGNFVVPSNCGAVENNMDFGFILGWDADNESIL